MCVLSEPPHQRYSPCIPALRVVESERQINIHSVLPAYPPSLPPHLWKMTPQPPQQTVVIHTAVVFIDIKQHSTISSFQPLHSLLFTCTFFTTYSSLSSPVLLLLFLLLLLIYYLIIIFFFFLYYHYQSFCFQSDEIKAGHPSSCCALYFY